ncbi:MAG TPA: hypothetical protein VG497_20140, partial [Kribbella sp.]|nr:hypothetical protein [Kribbella sp.]
MKALERWIVALLTTFVVLVTAVAVGGTARAWAMHARVPPSTQADVGATQPSDGAALATVLIIVIWLAWCALLLASVKGGRFLIAALTRS